MFITDCWKMELICTDSLWDSDLTWGNHRAYPKFTQCFQDTALLWLPTSWLFLPAPIYLYILLHFEDQRTQYSRKCWAKMGLAAVQLSVCYVQAGQTDRGLRYIGLIAQGFTLLLTMLLLDLENRKGFVTSGVQTIYWFLASVCAAVLLYSKFLKQEQEDNDGDLVLSKLYLGLAISQFIFTWFADVTDHQDSARECKFSTASFISRCTFSWFNSFMSLGYQRPIIDDDISDTMPSIHTRVAAPHFERIWNAEKKSTTKNGTNSRASCVNLLTVIIKANWPLLLIANVLKLLSQVFILAKPFITGFLVAFAEDLSQPSWKGYLYLLAGISCFIGSNIMGDYVCHLCDSTAMKLNSCLRSAVFKKSMRMTNKARAESTSGEIINICSQDIQQVQHFIAFFFWIWEVPFQVVSSLIILYYTVDSAAVAAVAVLILVMPINTIMARHGHNTHLARMDTKDKRIKLMTEVFNGIKILKLYAWELAFGKKILDVRNEELGILRKQRLFAFVGSLCWGIAPFMMGLVTFGVYIYISEDHILTAETAFRALTTFGMLMHTFNALPHVVCHFMRSFVSIRRLEKFLNNEEIPDDIVSHNPSDNAIKITNGTFTWDEKLGPCLKNINMSVSKGSLVAVVGTIGSGKSSLLSAMMGEMEKDEGNVNVDGSVAYVPQQAWIQNQTLKDNVLFGHAYREDTYNDVIDACSLRKDLEILPGKDMTEIGEKGINLSGGQKQRVSMARAVYFNADIYLLDDPLSAVDAHVGKDIFDHVISENGLLRNKTRILVTHGITWLPYVDQIFVVEKGRITETGTYQQLIDNDGEFAAFIKKYNTDGQLSDDDECKSDDGSSSLDSGYTSDVKASCSTSCLTSSQSLRRSISRSISIEEKSEKQHQKICTLDDVEKEEAKQVERETYKVQAGKLIDEEEIETGEVKLKYLVPYFNSFGLITGILILLSFLGWRGSEVATRILIKEWTGDSALSNITAVPGDSQERYDGNWHFMKIYALIGLVYCFTAFSEDFLMMTGILRAAKAMHQTMLYNILRGSMAFFDTTPVGRIVNRFSKDIEPLDGAISDHAHAIIRCSFGLISVFAILLTALPEFIVMGVPIFIAYREVQKRFVPIRRQVCRINSKRETPELTHFAECLNGVQVIRAFNMEKVFADQFADKIDFHIQTWFHICSTDRWMSIRLGVLNAVCFAAAACLAVHEREHLSGALIGLAISFVLELRENLECFVRISGEVERDVVSVERIGQYSSKSQEAPLHTDIVPRTSWPDSGKVHIMDYSVRYREGLDLVLKNINVQVKPGEKIGIVGRTGAGKSSLTLGLFRLIEPASGSINIDDEDISKIGLFDLRSNLIILPQDPVLFSGTLKTNLDPLDKHTDDELFTALEHAHLKSFVDSLPGKLTYDCGEGGKNLSVGQRQLICLARSLLRKSSVLVLDEATAAVDMKTDELIQKTIKKEFKDCTVLTIAHRLNTIIDYDRILVLENGEVKEFDSPKNLMEYPESTFYSMAKDARLIKSTSGIPAKS